MFFVINIMRERRRQTVMEWKRQAKLFFKVLLVAFVAVCCALFVRSVLYVPMEVVGTSMYPTLANHDVVLVQHFGQIRRFNIVVINQGGQTIIKRVIGLPGERLKYQSNHLYINGKRIAEPFLKTTKAQHAQQNFNTSDFTLPELTKHQRIPKNCYFVLGDNRPVSQDSRTYGFINVKNIQGKAVVVYYPLKDFKII